jgi:Ser/Thr protein kinase RdoA (MazF antagonist)
VPPHYQGTRPPEPGPCRSPAASLAAAGIAPLPARMASISAFPLFPDFTIVLPTCHRCPHPQPGWASAAVVAVVGPGDAARGFNPWRFAGLAGENAAVATVPALLATEARAAEALLGRVWGPASVRAAEPIWDRTHVVRLHLAAGRSVVMKKRAGDDRFGVELAALEYLNQMPEPVAPRLLGADADAGILLMEDLGPGASLADSLLTGDRPRVQADLISYAEALGSVYAWSMRRPKDPRLGAPPWPGTAARGKDAFLAAAASLGLAAAAAGTEIDQLSLMLNETGYQGLVHGDPCPDNVRFRDGRCRIFDFEHCGWGPVVLDASYLLAPFPSCWCFARLPASVAAPAMSAYRDRLQAAGIALGPSWDMAMTAALGAWILTWGDTIAKVLAEDDQWGTTTMRPRLLSWLRSFTDAAGQSGALPRLRVLADDLHERLSARWPQAVTADYPALARPGATQVQVPDFWQPEV